jgi:hypothetical protein
LQATRLALAQQWRASRWHKSERPTVAVGCQFSHFGKDGPSPRSSAIHPNHPKLLQLCWQPTVHWRIREQIELLLRIHISGSEPDRSKIDLCLGQCSNEFLAAAHGWDHATATPYSKGKIGNREVGPSSTKKDTKVHGSSLRRNHDKGARRKKEHTRNFLPTHARTAAQVSIHYRE